MNEQEKKEVNNYQYARGYVYNFTENQEKGFAQFDIQIQAKDDAYQKTYIKVFVSGNKYEKLKENPIKNSDFIEVEGTAQFKSYKDKNDAINKSNSISAKEIIKHDLTKNLEEESVKKEFKQYFPNRIELTTFLTKDAEEINTKNGKMLKANVANNISFKAKDSEEWESKVSFLDVVMSSNKKLDINDLKDSLKGDKIQVVGMVKNNKYTDMNNNTRYSTSVLATEAKLTPKIKEEVIQEENQIKNNSKGVKM